jgi:hypothetical protein
VPDAEAVATPAVIAAVPVNVPTVKVPTPAAVAAVIVAAIDPV